MMNILIMCQPVPMLQKIRQLALIPQILGQAVLMPQTMHQLVVIQML